MEHLIIDVLQLILNQLTLQDARHFKQVNCYTSTIMTEKMKKIKRKIAYIMSCKKELILQSQNNDPFKYYYDILKLIQPVIRDINAIGNYVVWFITIFIDEKITIKFYHKDDRSYANITTTKTGVKEMLSHFYYNELLMI